MHVHYLQQTEKEVDLTSRLNSLVPAEERLSALSLSERQHFLESVAYHKNMLVELADEQYKKLQKEKDQYISLDEYYAKRGI